MRDNIFTDKGYSKEDLFIRKMEIEKLQKLKERKRAKREEYLQSHGGLDIK